MPIKTFRFHPRITLKAALLIAGLGAMSIVANWFCLKSIEDLSQTNNTLSRQVAPARQSLAEARGSIEAMGLATYKTYAAGSRGEAIEFSSSIKDEYRSARNSLNNVQSHFPNRASEIGQMVEKLDRAYQIADASKVAVLAGERDKAKQILQQRFDAALDDTGGHMYRLINILGGEAKDVLEEAARQQMRSMQIIIAVLIGGTAVTLLLAMGFTQVSVARPLKNLERTMIRLAKADFSAPVEGVARRDEIGAMARAVSVFRDNGLALRDAERQRNTDRERTEAEKQAMLNGVADSFEREIVSVASSLASSAEDLERFARAMQIMADESGRHARTATDIAGRTQGGAETVAIAVEELSVSMTEIATQVVNASDVVSEATRCSDDAVSHASDLAVAVQHIDQVATLINAIAGKTNLLALNATIEAARAGEAGLGFAVVAQEVKMLAAQTTRALAEIKEKTSSVNQVIGGVQGATQAMSRVIGRIESISGAISHSVEQQRIASQRIAESVSGSADRTRQVSSTIEGVSGFADRTRDGAERILAAVAELNRQAGTLQQDAEQFANRVRAA